MKQKIRKIVTAALLSMAILGMSVPTLPASAASESVNECDHLVLVLGSTTITYLNASAQEHQVKRVKTYKCNDCKENVYEETKITTEPHQQISGTVKCICGYYLH